MRAEAYNFFKWILTFGLASFVLVSMATAAPEEPKVVRKAIPKMPDEIAAGESGKGDALSETPGEVTAGDRTEPGTLPPMPDEITAEDRTDPEPLPEISDDVAAEERTEPEPLPEISDDGTADDRTEPAPLPEISDDVTAEDRTDPEPLSEMSDDVTTDDRTDPASTSEDGDRPMDLLTALPSEENEKRVEPYSRDGKIDPFAPLFAKTEEPEPGPEPGPGPGPRPGPTPIKPCPPTPLTGLDLEQLKLVAIIKAPSGNRAMVEDSSGKGYILQIGTCVGIHSGRVAEIREGMIIIEEKYQDHDLVDGEWVPADVLTREREMKIERKYGA